MVQEKETPRRVEVIGVDLKKAWFNQVFDHFRNQCSSCGSQDHLRPKLIVPQEAGGKLHINNSILLCRTCEFASELFSRQKMPASGTNTRPINFWINRDLHKNLLNGLSHRYGFKSVASLVRFLMGKYTTSPEQFEDVEKYIDRSSDVKVNVWVPRVMYEDFKVVTSRNGLTVTGSLRGLLRMYESEAERIFGRQG